MFHFSTFHESVTDRRTDQRTDIPSYRDARTHLKTKKEVCLLYGLAFSSLITIIKNEQKKRDKFEKNRDSTRLTVWKAPHEELKGPDQMGLHGTGMQHHPHRTAYSEKSKQICNGNGNGNYRFYSIKRLAHALQKTQRSQFSGINENSEKKKMQKRKKCRTVMVVYEYWNNIFNTKDESL